MRYKANKLFLLVMIAGIFAVASVGFCKDSMVLTDRGYGAVQFGSNLQEIEKKLKDKAKSDTGEYDCNFVTFKRYPGIMFMVEKGIITRADVASAAIVNSLGIRIGTPLTEVKRRYPKALITPHKYNDEGHYVIFRSADGKRAIVFEEAEGKIGSVRAGLEPSAEYVEGCL